jgi:hypothetical protein
VGGRRRQSLPAWALHARHFRDHRGRPEGVGGRDPGRPERRLAGNLKLLPNGIEISIGAITAEDDRVAVEAESKATLVNGALYHNRYHFLFVVRDGRIHAVKEYLDTLHALSALTGARQSAQSPNE